MSKNVKVQLNYKGLDALRKSSEMQAILDKYGREKAAQAGDGYESQLYVFQKRAAVSIYPKTYEAKLDNYENNTLLKVIKRK